MVMVLIETIKNSPIELKISRMESGIYNMELCKKYELKKVL